MRGNVTMRGKGRWQLRVDAGIGDDGVRRQQAKTIRVRTKREAEEALRRWLTELGHTVEAGADSTIFDLIHAHLTQGRFAATTLDDYRRVVRLHLPAWLAEMPVWKVRPADLDRAYGELTRAGVSDHRVRRLHEVLSGAFGRAVRWQWVVRNPARDAQPPIPARADVRSPDHVEAMAILEAVEQIRWRGHRAADVACAIRVAMATGMRRGELVGLQWADIGLDTGQVIIRRAIAYTPASGVHVKVTKTDNVRVIAVDTGTVELLRSHRARAAATALGLGVPLADTSWVFAEMGRPWAPNFVTQAFERARAAAGHEDVTLHGLRHLQATHLLASGMEAKTVSGRLGHSRVSTTTDRYAAFMPARDREAARIAGEIFGA